VLDSKSINHLIQSFLYKIANFPAYFGAMETNKSANEPIIELMSSNDEVEQVSFNEKFQGSQLDTLAKHAARKENHMGQFQAVKDYGSAIFWSVMVSMYVRTFLPYLS
jgi:hypothetical protein